MARFHSAIGTSKQPRAFVARIPRAGKSSPCSCMYPVEAIWIHFSFRITAKFVGGNVQKRMSVSAMRSGSSSRASSAGGVMHWTWQSARRLNSANARSCTATSTKTFTSIDQDFSRHAVELTAARLERVAAANFVGQHDAKARPIRRQGVAILHDERAVDHLRVEAGVVGRDF